MKEQREWPQGVEVRVEAGAMMVRNEAVGVCGGMHSYLKIEYVAGISIILLDHGT